MVSESPINYQEISLLELGPSDVPMMMQRVGLTKPGPFSPRTIEMGIYIGVKIDGNLIAMGGERMKPEGYTEINAVCTHPEYRGKGYAKAITADLTNTILERGENPFLHVTSDNKPAISLYKKLGYKVRGSGQVAAILRK